LGLLQLLTQITILLYFNIGIDAGTGDGDWLPVTYEFYQSFVYDNNQESLPVKMGNGASSIAKFEHDHSSSAGKAIQVSVYSDLAYNGRINGGRVYIRESNSDNDLTLLVDIDILVVFLVPLSSTFVFIYCFH